MISLRRFLRLLLPFESREYDVSASCGEFMERIGAIVRGPLWFPNYWRCKGEFVGRVEPTRFRVARLARQPYAPLVAGDVVPHGQGCHVKLRFVGYQAFLSLLLLSLPVGAAKEFGVVGGAMFAIGVLGVHVLWCVNQRREIAIFLHAAGIETGRPQRLESFWTLGQPFSATRVPDHDDPKS